MNITQLREISELLSSSGEGWFSHKDQIKNIYEKDDYKKLIDEFDDFIIEIDSKKKPHLSLVFYISLLILNYDNLQEVADYVKDKRSFELLLEGIKIFLQSKDSNLKYEIEFNFDYYNNNLKAISRLSGHVGELNYKLSGIIATVEMVYYANKSKFYNLLEKDKQNGVFLYFMIAPELRLNYDDLVDFLDLNDEIKVDGSFYYLMSKFHSLNYRKEYEEDDSIEEKLQDELDRLKKIVKRISKEQRINLIVNYIFVEDVIPSFFINELKDTNIGVLIQNCEEQDLSNLSNLIRLSILIKEIDVEEIQILFKNYLRDWIAEEGNNHTWQRVASNVEKIINNLDRTIVEDLHNELVDLKKDLFITNFDRQVRHSMYLQDQFKEGIIEDVIGYC